MKIRSFFALLMIGALMLSGCASQEEQAPAPQTQTQAGPASFTEVDPDEYIELGRYQNFKEDEIAYGLTVSLQSAMAKAGYGESSDTELKSGKVQIGDTLKIDFKGLLNGVAFEGGTATGYSLTIGSGAFIDGFEEGLVGVAIGDTVDLDLTFPANYQSTELAGKAVVFEVTVHSVTKRVTYPELTDEIAKKLDSTVSSAQELKENLSGELYWALAMDQAILKKEIPDSLKEILRKEYANMLEAQFKSKGYESLEAALTASGITMDTFKQNYQDPYAEARSTVIMAAYAISKAEGFTLTEEIYNAKALEFAKLNGFETAEELIQAAGKEFINNNIMLETAFDIVANSAKEN